VSNKLVIATPGFVRELWDHTNETIASTGGLPRDHIEPDALFSWEAELVLCIDHLPRDVASARGEGVTVTATMAFCPGLVFGTGTRTGYSQLPMSWLRRRTHDLNLSKISLSSPFVAIAAFPGCPAWDRVGDPARRLRRWSRRARRMGGDGGHRQLDLGALRRQDLLDG
jgi:hypothetical protein